MNNDTQNRDKKQILLKSIQAEFESNLSQLDTVIFYNQKTLDAYPITIEIIKNNAEISDENIYKNQLIKWGYTWSFDPINEALRSGISSGAIHLINNDKLLELLFSWEDLVNNSKEEAIRLKNYNDASFELLLQYIRVGTTWKKLVPELIVSNYPSNYKALFNDVSFEDNVNLKFAFTGEYRTELNIIRENNIKILELIRQEVNN